MDPSDETAPTGGHSAKSFTEATTRFVGLVLLEYYYFHPESESEIVITSMHVMYVCIITASMSRAGRLVPSKQQHQALATNALSLRNGPVTSQALEQRFGKQA